MESWDFHVAHMQLLEIAKGQLMIFQSFSIRVMLYGSNWHHYSMLHEAKFKRNMEHWYESANQNTVEKRKNGNQILILKSMPIYCISKWFLQMDSSLDNEKCERDTVWGIVTYELWKLFVLFHILLQYRTAQLCSFKKH